MLTLSRSHHCWCFSLSLTYYGSFAQPLFISPPPWHHTILQARGVGTHTELSRQVAVQAAGCAWRGQAGWLAGRSWLVPPHWMRHLGSVSTGGGTDGQGTQGVVEGVKEKSRLWHLIQQMDCVKRELESSSRVKALKIITPLTHNSEGAPSPVMACYFTLLWTKSQTGTFNVQRKNTFFHLFCIGLWSPFHLWRPSLTSALHTFFFKYVLSFLLLSANTSTVNAREVLLRSGIFFAVNQSHNY